MGSHAIFAPSSAARWLACPVSAILAKDLPERTSDAADEGTRVHALIEQAIINKSIVHVPEDDEWVVELVLSYVAKLGPGDLFAERRVTLNDLCWGTVDITHVAPCGAVATIGDYKNGGYDVDAVGNKQLLSYAVGVLREVPSLRWFRFAIIQPNSRTHGEVEPIKQWVAPVEIVLAHAAEIDRAIAEAHAGVEPRPGKHCRWCPAFGECSATRSTMDFVATAVRMPPGGIPDDKIAQVARVLRGLEDFRKIVDGELNSRLLSGRTIPGATLEPTRAFRQWADVYLVKQRLFEAYGADAFEPLSPAKVEKLGSAGKEIAESLAIKPRGVLKAAY